MERTDLRLGFKLGFVHIFIFPFFGVLYYPFPFPLLFLKDPLSPEIVYWNDSKIRIPLAFQPEFQKTICKCMVISLKLLKRVLTVRFSPHEKTYYYCQQSRVPYLICPTNVS